MLPFFDCKLLWESILVLGNEIKNLDMWTFLGLCCGGFFCLRFFSSRSFNEKVCV